MKKIDLFDPWFLISIITILGLGFIMVASSSIPIAEGKRLPAFYFASHQAIYLLLGLVNAIIITYIPMRFWEKCGLFLLMASIFFLTVLLLPGVSRSVNGSVRWLFIGPFSIQVSECVKLATVIYMAGYLVRHEEQVRNEITGFVKPLIILGLISALLMLEPDFGATVVIVSTCMGMMFLSGVPIRRFASLVLLVLIALAVLSISSPYRVERMTSFLNPWADQFNSGYQLTQSLIAFGRGGWLGVGLGSSIQKLLYLPEPHTDFLFAVLAEELGLIGALLTVLLFFILIFKGMAIGKRAIDAQKFFHGYVAYGISLWLGIQTMINMGVNVGVLPTKGLTLPLMSYGSSSNLVVLVALGMLLRIDFETRITRL